MPSPERQRAALRHQLLSRLRCLATPSTPPPLQARLVALLYDTPLPLLEECLLQVCHVCLTATQHGVQDLLCAFMLWLAGCSLHVALRLSWAVDAVSSFYRPMTGLSARIKNIQDCIESYAINQVSRLPATLGTVASSSRRQTMTTSCDGGDGGAAADKHNNNNNSHNDDDDDVRLDSTHVLRKEARLKMYNDERHFVTALTDMSHALRCYSDRQRRKDELHRRLRELNARLRDMRLMHPLGSSDDAVCWVVQLAVSECTVFSSHTRAPFRLTYEVIVDDTATMRDPTASTLRRADGTFRVRGDADEVFVPQPPPLSPLPPEHEEAHDDDDNNNNNNKNEHDDDDDDEHTVADSLPYLRDVFGENMRARAARVRRQSAWGRHPRWQLRSLIVKAGDDLRQEELALQIIALFDETWRAAGVTCALHPYRALSTSADSGLLEVVDDAMSIDSIKKMCGVTSLYTFFVNAYDGHGGDTAARYLRAQRRFVESMAAYSVVSYILQIKDRHNGNLLLTRDGALVHIDFGYLVATSPGGLNFESAPFKLSQELLDIMGGSDADAYNYYKVLVYQALDTARACADDVLSLLALMVPYTTMPCFGADPLTSLTQLRGRFRDDLPAGADLALHVRDLIVESADNWRTRRYDQFQTLQNGIL